MIKRIFKIIFLLFVICFFILFSLSFKKIPAEISYGVSFSKFHSNELGIDWKETFLAILNELKVKKFRFSAHWPEVEPKDGSYNFEELDFEMKKAEENNASAIIGVGRRLPGWPECHEPEWEKSLSNSDKKKKLISYITAVVNRYKNSKALTEWQVENEPYLGLFAKEACGTFDPSFFAEEIALVRKLDPSHKILVTDSGEFGYWNGSYQSGDIFGSTMYLYVWNKAFGPIRYPIIPAYFRIRQNISALLFGSKSTILAELGAEPWLVHPITEVSIDDQLKRMDLAKFNEVLSFAEGTGFQEQYLWGAEWWYYMKGKNHPEFWSKAKEIFK